MRNFRRFTLALCIAGAMSPLAGCNREAGTGAAPAAAAPSANVAAAPATPSATAPAQPAGFDIAALPLSTVPLGEFPYFTLPAGYTAAKAETREFARFPFRVDGKDHWIEGRFHSAAFTAEPGKTFSAFEVQKNFDTVIGQLGGRKVADGRLPTEVVKAWGAEITDGFKSGVDPAAYRYPEANSTVWVIRRGDGNIWVYLTANDTRGGYVVGREAALSPTSTLIGAASLKQAIDAAGKVAVQVNFATDRSDILPESQPQVDEIVQLLKADPALRLAINGHTDDTGTAAHNQALSEARARSVVAALVAKGIPAESLKPAGIGNSQPIADNASEAGKARNRRVELVKL